MPSLDLRDRLLQTTVVYVGAPGAGTSTNVKQLADRRAEWSARSWVELDDCEVVVSVQEAAYDDVRAIDAADAAVLVLDSDPASLAIGRRMIASLRRRPRLSVVQLNKRDLADAVSEDAFDLRGLIAVPAVATEGLGVIDTLKHAVQGALRMAMESPEVSQSSSSSPSGRASTEDNPLLAALKTVIAAAVAAEVKNMEQRIASDLRAIAESNEQILQELKRSRKSWFG